MRRYRRVKSTGFGEIVKSLQQIAQALAERRVTSRQLVENCLERIADPAGEGARVFIELYADSARMGADGIDALRRAGRAPGPFAGIPVTIKDLFDVAGEVTRAGSVVLANAPPATAHAQIVERLLAAGFVLMGRTNMTEFAFSGVGLNPHYGTPLSPWDRATGRIPGGSSSGAAVSVSDRFAYAGIGTDTGGSCRIPAALCGIVGFKPTARRVPQQGVLPLAPSLDSVGPLANTVACCATLDQIMSGQPAAPLPSRDVAGLRLLLPVNFAFQHLDRATEAAFDRAVRQLDRAGAVVERRRVAAFDHMDTAHSEGGFAAPEAYAWHQNLLATHAAGYDPRVASRIMTGADMTAPAYFRLTKARNDIITQFNAEMAPFDALIMPTVPIQPPALTDFADDSNYKRLNFLLLRLPSAINFVDGCAISVPCQANGAPPAGLMIAAPGLRDDLLLPIAAAIEQHLV
jgi:aspartyl-tRNA(Asn)/glutamyl-tRNA(Gln) amidotransferase subunit A